MELDRVGAYIEDKVVLVTGAGGSIGAELCRQIARVRPKLLVLLDHAEDNLFQIERELTEQWHFTGCEAVLADCKEPDRMLEVMSRFHPDIVFHAAAYKHVGLMEMNPLEAVRNNAIATKVTAETAAAAGASRFVLVSTDKAVNPQTVMGASKAMAEWIVAAAGQRHSTTRFVSVRFGNVLGSSGSVVPIFRSQIEKGGPVTVTHPDMERYFMTIPEAVQLVIKAGDLGAGTGEVFVLEMGEPVKIVDLARNMIHLAGYEPETGDRDRVHGPAPRREAGRGALERRRALPADERGADRACGAARAARPRMGRADRRAPHGARRLRRRDRPRGARGGVHGRSPPRPFVDSPHFMDVIEDIGPILGIVAFLGFAILALLIVLQAREVRRLREWAGRAPERAVEADDASLAASEEKGDLEKPEKPSRLKSVWRRVTGSSGRSTTSSIAAHPSTRASCSRCSSA